MRGVLQAAELLERGAARLGNRLAPAFRAREACHQWRSRPLDFRRFRGGRCDLAGSGGRGASAASSNPWVTYQCRGEVAEPCRGSHEEVAADAASSRFAGRACVPLCRLLHAADVSYFPRAACRFHRQGWRAHDHWLPGCLRGRRQLASQSRSRFFSPVEHADGPGFVAERQCFSRSLAKLLSAASR